MTKTRFMSLMLAAMLSLTTVHAKFNTKACVTKDSYGVWNIKALTLYQAFEEMGYQVACDRLWQAELLRRTGKGRLSELFGPDLLTTDVYMRTTGYSQAELDSEFNTMNHRTRNIISAYVAGFNRRLAEIADNPDLLPFEFIALGQASGQNFIMPENWSTSDVLALSVAILRNFDGDAMDMGQLNNLALFQELQEKFPNQFFNMFNDLRWLDNPKAMTMIPGSARTSVAPAAQPVMRRGSGQRFNNRVKGSIQDLRSIKEDVINKLKKINAYVKMGSYAWVVSGQKTSSGRPILYSGPQMGFSAPSVIMEGSIETPLFKASGMLIPGIPAIIVGRTPHHAWSMQVGHAHTVDYYLEAADNVSLHRMETISVAGAEDVTLPVFRSNHGPIIHPMPYNPQANNPAIISWKYSHWKHELKLVKDLFNMAKARCLSQFRRAAKSLPVSMHICYTDNWGNIAYMMTGRNPLRPAGLDTRLPLVGDGTQEWLEPVTYREMPFDVNPVQGYYGGWNNKASADYPNNNNIYVQNGSFHRAKVIDDYLKANNNLSFEQVRDLALNIAATDSFKGEIDTGGNTWEAVKSYFIAAVEANPTEARLAALEMLSNWDGHFIAGGPEQWATSMVRDDAWLLQSEWITEVMRLTFEDELQTATMTWENQPKYTLFNVLMHALEGDDSGVPGQYNWFNDTAAAGTPTEPAAIIVLALDNVLAQLGPQPWQAPRGEIIYTHDLLGEVGRTPFSSRSTYAQCVEYSFWGPSRIETMFPLGQSGHISLDPTIGAPVFDQYFFSTFEIFNSFTHKPAPLFNPFLRHSLKKK